MSTRRNFLVRSASSIFGGSALLNALGQTVMSSNAFAAPNSNYKALVCLFFAGGNDSFNMLVPNPNTGEYTTYESARGTRQGNNPPAGGLALKPSEILTLDSDYGVNSAMPNVASMYQSNEVTFVSNVGMMVKPTTLSDVVNGTNLPRALYSHSDQIVQWQNARPNLPTSPTGWAGRASDWIKENYSTGSLGKIGYSLSGNSVFLAGKNIAGYSIGSGGAPPRSGYDQVQPGLDRIMVAEPKRYAHSRFKEGFATSHKESFDAQEIFRSSFTEIPDTFPGTSLGNGLKSIARTIATTANHPTPNLQLGGDRQIFFLQLGGWDMHNGLYDGATTHASKLSQVDAVLKAFRDAMVNLGLHNQVTTFTASEFGRTLRSNGFGSDHAWGGNALVMGGAVDGGKVHGSWPDLTLGGSNDVSGADLQGRLLPTTAADKYFAELLNWLDVPLSEIKGTAGENYEDGILPNYHQFVNEPAINFMGGNPV